MTQPTIVDRDEQPYVAIPGTVTMSTMSAIIDRLPEVFAWLADHDIEPAGPPFFRYVVIDMDSELTMEVGVPVSEVPDVDAPLIAGTLPAGRYATVIHKGHPANLVATTADLLAWAADAGLRWDVEYRPGGEHWGSRLEFYLNDPAVEPDMNTWDTELAFRLAD